MKNFVIPPIKNLDLYKLGNAGFFALGQLIKDSTEYEQYVRNLIKNEVYVILDSGVGDHNPITQDELYKITIDLMPSEVIPLDTLFNKSETLYNMDTFCQKMQDDNILGRIKILGCPQGQSKEEWYECYKSFLYNDNVNVIGMSKLTIPHVWRGANNDSEIAEARVECIDYLNKWKMLLKPLHFLGMGDPREFEEYKILCKSMPILEKRGIFRSTDSCNVIWSAMNDQSWRDGKVQRIKTPLDYFQREVFESAIDVAESNARFLRNILEF